MGRMYTVVLEGVAVTDAGDLIELTAPSDAVVVLHRIHLGQSSDAADAQAEMLGITLSRVGTTGSGGSALTSRPHQVGDPTFGGSVAGQNTTDVISPVTILEEAFNVQAGWYYVPTPEERIVISPSGGLVLNPGSTPADSLTMHLSMTFEEIGG